MTRNLSIALGSCAIIGLSFFSIQQVGSIAKKNELLVKQDQYITELKTVTKEDDSVIVDLRSENQVLKEQIHILKDSIEFLNNTILNLRQSTQEQNRAIADVQSQLELYQARYDQLELAMSETKVMTFPDNPADAKKIADLQAAKADLMAQVRALQAQKVGYETIKAENEMEILYRESAEANFQRITNIIDNTHVLFKNIKIQKSFNGKSMKKVHKKWNYTSIDFQLIADNPQLLMEQRFLVRLVNTDTQEILKTIAEGEGGEKAFEDFETDGAIVQFTGGEVNVSYYNHQPKTGQNYEIQIFYLDDSGKEYLLNHGTKRFVKNGKTI